MFSVGFSSAKSRPEVSSCYSQNVLPDSSLLGDFGLLLSELCQIDRFFWFCFHSGWVQCRLPSIDNEDFETIPSSAEESSNSSEEEGGHKNVSFKWQQSLLQQIENKEYLHVCKLFPGASSFIWKIPKAAPTTWDCLAYRDCQNCLQKGSNDSYHLGGPGTSHCCNQVTVFWCWSELVLLNSQKCFVQRFWLGSGFAGSFPLHCILS